MRIEGIGVREVGDNGPLELGRMRCDPYVGLEFLCLFSFADNGAYLISRFECKNESLKSDVTRDTGDLERFSDSVSLKEGGTLTRMRSPAMVDWDEKRLVGGFV